MADWAAQGIRFAARTGRCPMCGIRPRAKWKDTGALRITCGHDECFRKWIPGSREVLKNEHVMPNKVEE